MNCCFNSEPCRSITCPLWSERHQACRFVMAVDKILGDDGERKVNLTPTEQKVMNLIIQGYSNKQISVALSNSHQTIKNHISNILAKLGAKSRTEAVIMSFNKNKQGGV